MEAFSPWIFLMWKGKKKKKRLSLLSPLQSTWAASWSLLRGMFWSRAHKAPRPPLLFKKQLLLGCLVWGLCTVSLTLSLTRRKQSVFTIVANSFAFSPSHRGQLAWATQWHQSLRQDRKPLPQAFSGFPAVPDGFTMTLRPPPFPPVNR